MVHRSQGRLNLGKKLWQQAGACVGMCSAIQVEGKNPTAYCRYVDHGKVSQNVGRLIGSWEFCSVTTAPLFEQDAKK